MSLFPLVFFVFFIFFSQPVRLEGDGDKEEQLCLLVLQLVQQFIIIITVRQLVPITETEGFDYPVIRRWWWWSPSSNTFCSFFPIGGDYYPLLQCTLFSLEAFKFNSRQRHSSHSLFLRVICKWTSAAAAVVVVLTDDSDYCDDPPRQNEPPGQATLSTALLNCSLSYTRAPGRHCCCQCCQCCCCCSAEIIAQTHCIIIIIISCCVLDDDGGGSVLNSIITVFFFFFFFSLPVLIFWYFGVWCSVDRSQNIFLPFSDFIFLNLTLTGRSFCLLVVSFSLVFQRCLCFALLRVVFFSPFWYFVLFCPDLFVLDRFVSDGRE